MYCDSHTHIDQIVEIDMALREAKALDVRSIAAMSVDFESCRNNLQIIEKYSSSEYPEIFLGLGVHPGQVRQGDTDACLDLMRVNVNKINVVGEIGLDFWYPWVRKDELLKKMQREAFSKMLCFATENGLPVSVHSRGKWQECFDEVSKAGIKKAVFHWYSGPLNVLKQIIDEGYLISVTPSLAYSNESQQAALTAPLEQTMIETDCPVYYRNKETDDPGFESTLKDVIKTFDLYVNLKKLDKAKAAEVLYRNSYEFFKKKEQ